MTGSELRAASDPRRRSTGGAALGPGLPEGGAVDILAGAVLVHDLAAKVRQVLETDLFQQISGDRCRSRAMVNQSPPRHDSRRPWRDGREMI